MTNETHENYSEIEEILKPLADQLTSDVMIDLNYHVDEVAKTYLTENGLLSGE